MTQTTHKRLLWFSVIFIALVGVIVAIEPAFANPVFTGDTNIIPKKPPKVVGDINLLIQKLFEFGIKIASLIFFMMFLVGGIQYLGGAGNEDQTGKAKKMMVDSVVGLIIVLASWSLGGFVLKQFGLAGQTTPTPSPAGTQTQTQTSSTSATTAATTPISTPATNGGTNPFGNDPFSNPRGN